VITRSSGAAEKPLSLTKKALFLRKGLFDSEKKFKKASFFVRPARLELTSKICLLSTICKESQSAGA
jgi:hypothetical protein